MKLIDLKQNTPEWKEFRRLRIGASDANKIMGYFNSTPYKWWEAKVMEREIPDNERMKRGRDLEPLALKEFNREHQYNNEPAWTPAVAVHDDYDWFMASFDGWNGKISVEIKCPLGEDHQIALNGIIPEHYIPQLQHQMLVSNTNVCYYFSFDGQRGITLECKRNDEYCEKLFAIEKEMQRKIRDWEEPELTDRDIISKNNDVQWNFAASHWKKAKEKSQEAEIELKQWREKLIELSGVNSCQGSGIKVLKIPRQGNVDYNSIPELQFVDKDKYRKPGSMTWRVS